MATFTPPFRDGNPMTSPEANTVQNRLMRFYDNWAQGVTVWKDSLGVWHESLEPYLGGATHATHNQWINGAGPISTVTAPDEGLATAQVVYQGGHIHTITEAAADELEAQGYSMLTRQSIAESFDGPDAPGAGPDLDWEEGIFTDQPYHVARVNNDLWFHSATPGAWEEIQVPTPNLDSPNFTGEIAVTNIVLTGTGDHHVGMGAIGRWESLQGGAYYRGYAVEISRTNIFVPGFELWICILWRVDGPGQITLLDSDATALANVAFPGTLSFTMDGSALSVSFAHAGAGPTLTASAEDSTYPDGKLVLGWGHVQSNDETATTIITNFSAGPA